MPVRAKMPLKKMVEAIRGTTLHWLHKCLMGFAEKMSEGVEALLERALDPIITTIFFTSGQDL